MNNRSFGFVLLFGATCCIFSCLRVTRPENTYAVYISDDKLLKFDKDGEYSGKQIWKVEVDETDSLVHTGFIAYIPGNDEREYKIGNWRTTRFDSTLISEGEYRIGTYIDCCVDGPCRAYYNFKVGPWQYFHHDGCLKARGVYNIDTISIKTRCGQTKVVRTYYR